LLLCFRWLYDYCIRLIERVSLWPSFAANVELVPGTGAKNDSQGLKHPPRPTFIQTVQTRTLREYRYKNVDASACAVCQYMSTLSTKVRSVDGA
jgi:hypothetical protein